MEVSYIDQAIELLEKANADLEPELLTAATARKFSSPMHGPRNSLPSGWPVTRPRPTGTASPAS